MKGVLMLVKEFPPLSVGGAELQAERLAAYLVQKGLPTIVVTRRADNLPALERKDLLEIVRVGSFGPGKLNAVTFTIGAILAVLKRRKSFDILHAHLEFSAAVAAAIAGKLLGKPVIVKYGGSGASSEVHQSRTTLWGKIRIALLQNWINLHIVLTDEMEEELLSAGFISSRIIHMVNGVNSNLFISSSNKHALKTAVNMDGKTLIVYVGRLVPVKALPVLLAALKHAVKSCPDLQLLLIGEGEEQDALKENAESLDVQSHTTFVGAVKDVRPYLSAADIFVLPSLGEGISNSLLEAMASGLACIATRVGGSVEALDNGDCGILIEPNNINQLSAAIIQLASDPQTAAQLGSKARQRILDKYDFTAIGEQYFSLYNKLLITQKL